MKLRLLWRASDVLDAELVAAQLRGSDIFAVLQLGPVPGAGGMLQSAEVYVDEKDFERAKEIIKNAKDH